MSKQNVEPKYSICKEINTLLICLRHHRSAIGHREKDFRQSSDAECAICCGHHSPTQHWKALHTTSRLAPEVLMESLAGLCAGHDKCDSAAITYEITDDVVYLFFATSTTHSEELKSDIEAYIAILPDVSRKWNGKSSAIEKGLQLGYRFCHAKMAQQLSTEVENIENMVKSIEKQIDAITTNNQESSALEGSNNGVALTNVKAALTTMAALGSGTTSLTSSYIRYHTTMSRVWHLLDGGSENCRFLSKCDYGLDDLIKKGTWIPSCLAYTLQAAHQGCTVFDKPIKCVWINASPPQQDPTYIHITEQILAELASKATDIHIPWHIVMDSIDDDNTLPRLDNTGGEKGPFVIRPQEHCVVTLAMHLLHNGTAPQYYFASFPSINYPCHTFLEALRELYGVPRFIVGEYSPSTDDLGWTLPLESGSSAGYGIHNIWSQMRAYMLRNLEEGIKIQLKVLHHNEVLKSLY